MSHLLSDEPALPGLLWAMRFDADGRGRMVGPGEEIPPLGRFGEGFVWLHVNLNDARVPGLIAEGRFGPPGLAGAAFASDPHQRVTVEDGQVGGVIADLAREGDGPPGPERLADAAGRLHFVLGPNFLVSGRRHPIVGPDALREAIAEGRALPGPVALLETLIGQIAAAIAARGGAMSEQIDGIEDHILDERIREETRQLGPIRRDAVRLHRQLNGLRAVFHRLEEEGDALPEATLEAAARIAQRLDAIDRDMVVLADRSRLLQEELSALLARQSNRQLQTLSVLTALFLPPTLVTGLFGMNTKGLPLADWEEGSTVAILIAVASAAAAFLLIRRLGIGGQKG
ncbi:CorA family divalent cation transporter [Methylobacterium aquaticum]|jgi:zinc transporter|uniref:Magnesium transporter CorA n=1 Tax=Methylobacterium aquaticum TaxID=270351 RepID=A0A0J6SC18_9HYPH|nr:CorA family divalent cation transporter [Methylobacterium aquaticum]KMO32760.1 magnesium transporter CorA [Methylobacterium aquaticum]